MSTTRSSLRTAGVAARAMIVFTIVLGVGYMLLITAIGQLTMPERANGSLLRSADGEVAGSALIGQSFSSTELGTSADAAGDPLPEYFQSRPSAAGEGYDSSASSGSNLGPNNEDLVATIEERRSAVAELEGVDPAEIPPGAVTASGSGLDPDIDPDYAALQVPRIAAARGIDEQTVRDLVASHVQPRDLGYIGEERINVLQLNLALDAL